MSRRTELSQRHKQHERYELVEPEGKDGTCVIRDAAGRTARVKASWLETEGTACWPDSVRKAIHVKASEWEG